MAVGTVKWFNSQKGYGFIQPQSGGKDVFVHISAVERAGLSGLNEGQVVEYEEVANKGKTSAENLKIQRWFCIDALGGYRMAKKSTRRRRAWTTADVRTLKTQAKKTKAARIARTLKRTEGATRQKAFSLGLSLNSRANVNERVKAPWWTGFSFDALVERLNGRAAQRTTPLGQHSRADVRPSLGYTKITADGG
jgi:cold shock protein